MTGLECLEMSGNDTFCEICGEWVNLAPGIDGRDSGEGRYIEGRLICASCEEKYGEAEGW